MRKVSPFRHFKLLVRQGVRAELADPERLISPVLLAVTLLLLFAFALGEVDPEMRRRVFVAETFLTLFFALQVSFARLFDPDREDRVFDVLRTSPLSHTAWFLAKCALVILMGAATLVPTLVMAAFLQQSDGAPMLTGPVLAIAGAALIALAPPGVLLSALTLRAESRQILYPLLYFPLTAPVLLAAVQAALLHLESGQILVGPSAAWAGLLGAFVIIYFTLGLLLFGELVEE